MTTPMTYLTKIWQSIEQPTLWGILTSIGLFFQQYVFHQWGFAIGFLIILICDTLSGVYVAIRRGEYSSTVFRQRLLDKTVAYFTIIIAFSAGTKIMLEESDINIIQYLNIPFYSLFIAAELRSIVLKWYEFKGWSWLGDLLHLIDKQTKENIDQSPDEAPD